ncbi:MAG: hydrogenase iron-sulfur subunit [Caldilinea sp. CFX5]|nr:hydrogenase iron-sulfur subunit [Caldilinea sp. CFX5]
MKQRSIYATRRPLRRLEGWWTRLERFINRLGTLATHPYNPLYHLGTLLIFLLIVLTVTGAYLTLLYRPGSDRAYASVVLLSANWFGSLMRTVHRYTSDALLLVTFLHAWKMFVSDRFWGSRWFAWVTGWVLLFLFWLTGTMGYFLVWDQPAQWLTDYAINLLRGAFAYSFLGPDAASRTFSFFVIILFLHVFIPLLLLVAVLVHVLRLARARYWSPRWLMIMSSVILIVLALLWPVVDGAPADLGQLIQQVKLDWWYLGFLPLTSQWSNGLLWSVSLAVIALVAALPWLLRGQHTGPAFVIAPKCTGCALCARECPYDAIAMQPRDDDTQFSSLAVVNANRCTGCGVCVGACADAAIELEGLHAAVMRQDLLRASAQAHKAKAPVIVFTCDRHAALGTLPPLEGTTPVEALGLGVGGELPLIQAKLPARVNAGSWPDDQGQPQPVMTCVVPCMGMLHPQWAAETVAAGAAGAIMVTCPNADCSYREGPHWVAERMKRRRTLRAGNTYILELAPGSQAEVMRQWRSLIGQPTTGAAPVTAVGQTEPTPVSPTPLVQARHLAVGFLLLLVLFGLSTFLDQPAHAGLPAAAQIRLALNHSGQLVAAASNLSPEVLAKLPPNVDPAQVLGGERFPVQIQLLVDGAQVLERTYRPRGLRREGAVYGLEEWWVQPGAHHLTINLMDDGASWRTVFSDTVTIAPGAAQILYFVHDQDKFVMR